MIIVDHDQRVLYVNPALAAGIGYAPESSSADLLERIGYRVVREDGSPWPVEERPVQLAARTGQVTRRQLMGVVREGETRWLRVSAWPLGDDPATSGAVGTYSDVTQRERDRLALVESETHFRLLAENSTDVITRHLADGTCLSSHLG